MNYKPLLIIFFLFQALTSFAYGTDTLRFFYDINHFELTDDDKQKLNEMVKSIQRTDTVKIFGYADYLGDEDDNMELSFNRAKTIKEYLLTLNKDFIIITAGEGELPSRGRETAKGDPNNRRVDIIKIKYMGRFIPLSAQRNNAPARPKNIIIRPGPEDTRPLETRINDLAKLKPGASLSMPEITFQAGRHILNPESVPMVDTLLKYLKNHKNLSFEIRGHICCVLDDGDSYDPDTRTFDLSANRARFIFEYFSRNGISADRMHYKGLGSSDPKVWPEITEHDRALNRRVEIVIVNNATK